MDLFSLFWASNTPTSVTLVPLCQREYLSSLCHDLELVLSERGAAKLNHQIDFGGAIPC